MALQVDAQCNCTNTMMMMPMSFNTDYNQTILFSGWTTNTAGEFAGACMAVFCLAFLYEVERLLREKIDQWIARGVQVRRLREKIPLISAATNATNGTPNVPVQALAAISGPVRIPFRWQALRAAVHFLHYTHAYCLMLIVMTFSTGLFFSVMAGVAFGFFCFQRDVSVRRPPLTGTGSHGHPDGSHHQHYGTTSPGSSGTGGNELGCH